MAQQFFPRRPEATPMIYAYEDVSYPGLLKVGYTAIDVPKRVAQQYPVIRPGERPYRIVFAESAMRNDGTVFTDEEIAFIESMIRPMGD